MRPLQVFIYLLLLLSGISVAAQDTLPKFTVKNKSGKIILSWTNNYPSIKQISIQRSSDSIFGFRTILSVPDPKATNNGFLDSKAPDTLLYYRLFILLDSSHYLFSKALKPEKDTVVVVAAPPPQADTAVAVIANTRVINPNLNVAIPIPIMNVSAKPTVHTCLR